MASTTIDVKKLSKEEQFQIVIDILKHNKELIKEFNKIVPI